MGSYPGGGHHQGALAKAGQYGGFGGYHGGGHHGGSGGHHFHH